MFEIAPFVVGASAGKSCRGCGEWKPRDLFSKCSSHTDGLSTYCKDCSSQKYAEWDGQNKDARKAYKKAYQEKNRDAISKKQRAWYERNIDHVRQYTAENAEKRRAYYMANRDEILANHREYRLALSPEEKAARNERYRDYVRVHPEVKRSSSNAYRARKRAASGYSSPADIEAIRKAQGNRCYICGKKLKKYHIDHFIPLSKGGTNDPGNLRLACPHCNQRKSDIHPHDLGLLL